MAIKKIIMYVDVNTEEVLDDDFYRENFDGYIHSGSSSIEAISNVSEEALNLVMDSVFTDEKYVNDYEFEIKDVSEDDKEDFRYQELLERIELEAVSDEEEA